MPQQQDGNEFMSTGTLYTKDKNHKPFTISGRKAANKIVFIFLSKIEDDDHKKAEFFTLLIQQIMC